MRPFYFNKQPNGYYRLRVVDQNTGRYTIIKSTHKKTYAEALTLYLEWQKNGFPAERINARKKSTSTVSQDKKANSAVFAPSQIVAALDDDKSRELLSLLAEKMGVAIATDCAVEKPTETAAAGKACSAKNKKNTAAESGDGMNGARLAFAARNFGEYLVDFWTPEKSAYIRERRSHGHGCTERYCSDMKKIALSRVSRYFEGDAVGDVTADDLDDYFMMLRNVRELAAATVNKTMVCISVAMGYAKQKNLIDENPVEQLEKFAGPQRDRGIPTDEEVTKLFKLDWENPAAKMANMLAAFCGMRLEEIQALRVCDVGDDVIHVMHGFNPLDRLKCTKNGKVRDVPVPAQICALLRDHAKGNRFYSDSSYVFYAKKVKCDTPTVQNVFDESLNEAYALIGISEDERMERNLVFHSWRHYYATKMTMRLKLEQAQQALGHLTPDMTRHYADHRTKEGYELLQEAVNENYKFIITVPETA